MNLACSYCHVCSVNEVHYIGFLRNFAWYTRLSHQWIIKVTLLRDITLCILSFGYWCFVGAWYLHLQDGRRWKQQCPLKHWYLLPCVPDCTASCLRYSFSFFLYFSIPLLPHFKISYSHWSQMKYDCILCIQVCVDIWQKCKGFHCEHIMNECNTFTNFFNTLENTCEYRM